MRVSMIRQNGKTGIGLWQQNLLRARFEGQADYPGSLDTWLARGKGLEGLEAILIKAPAIDSADIRFLPPLLKPAKILCAGLNYRDHAAETGMAVPEWPAIFARFASSLTAHNEAIRLPALSTQLDYEGELAIVIGHSCRSVSKADALSRIAGYSVFNDATIRDWQTKSTQWTLGKNFDGTGSFGPALVSPDELPSGAAGLRIRTRLNGTSMQDGNTSNMIFDPAGLISILSQAISLEPGDVIITGTPAGVGYSRTPPLFLKSGDVVEVEIDGVGLLRNTVKPA